MSLRVSPWGKLISSGESGWYCPCSFLVFSIKAVAELFFREFFVTLPIPWTSDVLQFPCLHESRMCSFRIYIYIYIFIYISSNQVKTNFGIYLIPSERLSLTYLIIVDSRWWEIFKARSKKCLQTNWLQILYLIVGRSFSLKSETFVMSPASHCRWACCRLDFGWSAFAVQNAERVV